MGAAFEIDRRALIVAGLIGLTLGKASWAQSSAARNGSPFGLIEIGSKGVKPAIVRILVGEAPDLEFVESFPSVEANAVDPGNAPIVAQAVKDAMAKMAEKGIADNSIVVVGSSGVASVPAAAETVAAAVLRATGKPVDFVSVDKEVEFTFDAIVNKKRLAHRRMQVALLDIGSGNTKGGFLKPVIGNPDGEFSIFSMPLATATFASAVAKAQRDDENFSAAALRLADTELRVAVQGMILQAGSTLAQRPRVYLNGGIPWVLATTQNPYNTDRYVPLAQSNIDRFVDQALYDQTGLFSVRTGGIGDPKHRKVIEDDLARMSAGKVFTPDELIAGALVLRTVASEMAFANKTLFFARPGRVAWLIGYVFDLLTDGRISDKVLPG